MSDEKKAIAVQQETKPAVEVGGVHGGLVPRNLEELQRLAAMMHASGMMPTSMKTPQAVAVAVMSGMEIGLSPMQAVQNIAVINGRPCLWGDAMLGLVRGSGLLEDYQEEALLDEKTGALYGYAVRAKRKGQGTIIQNTFTLDDAKKARLLGKPGPWQEYPDRMLKMRARGFTLRDGFPDVLKGLVSREEAMDLPPTDDGSVKEKLDATFRPALPARAVVVEEDPPKPPEKPQDERNEPDPPQDPPQATPVADDATGELFEADPYPENENVVRGVVEVVTSKPVKNGTRYGVKVGGEFFNTFSDSDGRFAQQAKMEDLPVEITWESRDGKYKDIVKIVLAPPAEGQNG